MTKLLEFIKKLPKKGTPESIYFGEGRAAYFAADIFIRQNDKDYCVDLKLPADKWLALRNFKKIDKIAFSANALTVNELQSFEGTAEKLPEYLRLGITLQGQAVNAQDFKHLANFMSDEGCRPYLCGVYYDSEKQALVATNGHILYKLDTALIFSEGFIIPAELVKILASGKKERYKLEYYAGYVYVYNDDFVYRMRAVDGRFPDYSRVIPKTEGTIQVIKSGALYKKLLELPRTRRTEITWEGKNGRLVYYINTEGVKSAEQSFDFAGVSPLSKYNLNYILRGLEPFRDCEEIEVFAENGKSPLKFTSGGQIVCVMPIA